MKKVGMIIVVAAGLLAALLFGGRSVVRWGLDTLTVYSD